MKQSLSLNLQSNPTEPQVVQQYHNQVQQVVQSLTQYGSTNERPTTNLFIGRRFFDTTLNQPVTWNGSQWVGQSTSTSSSNNQIIQTTTTAGGSVGQVLISNGSKIAPTWSFIPVSSLSTSYLTLGSTNIALGATSTTLAGLTSVTSTTFTGTLNGNASSATNIGGGLQGNIPYQTGPGATSFLTTGSSNQVLISGLTPGWTNTPTLTGTNFTGIPNAGLTNSSLTIGSTNIALGATSATLAGLTSVASDKYIVSGSTCSIAAGPGAGTGPTVSVTGKANAGTITITTGTGPSASAVIATITYPVAYSTNSYPVISWASSNSSTSLSDIWVSGTASTFTINAKTALTATTTYTWNFISLGV